MLKGYLRLWPFVYPYRWSFVFTVVLSFALAGLAPMVAVLGKLLVDSLSGVDFVTTYPDYVPYLSHFLGDQAQVEGFLRDPLRVVKAIAISFPIFYFVFGLVRYYYYFNLRFLEERIINEIRYSIMNRLMVLSPKFYMQNTQGSGGLLSRTLNDTMVIQSGLQYYSDLLREPIAAVAALFYMFSMNWKVTTFCLIFLPFFSLIIRTLTKALRSLAHRSMDSLGKVTNNLKEGLDGMRVIQSYNLEDSMRLRFRNSIDNYNYIRRKVIKRMELASPLNEFMASLLLSAIIVWVGKMVSAQEMILSDFLGIVIAAALLDKPVKKIQTAMINIQPTAAAVERVFEVIDSDERVKEPNNPKPIPMDWKQIEFKNVSFNYGGENVLKSVNLTVKRGEIIALVGESGSGKSTLVNLLERFFDPTEGEISIDGISISDFTVRDLRHQIALVTQDVFLFDASVTENIQAGDSTKPLAKVFEAAEKANATKFIDRLPEKFDSKAGEKGGNFSGGEKQRISIARAIYKDAPILILDEATSALDSASEAEVQRGIQSLMQGRTAFVVAHRLSTISSAHRILVMSKGVIVEEGNHQELLAKGGLYKHYHTLQVQMEKNT